MAGMAWGQKWAQHPYFSRWSVWAEKLYYTTLKVSFHHRWEILSWGGRVDVMSSFSLLAHREGMCKGDWGTRLQENPQLILQFAIMIQLTSRRILRDCKRTACDRLDDLVRCTSASVPMDPWSLWSIVPFPLVRWKGQKRCWLWQASRKGSDSSQLRAKGFVGRRRKWGYQKEIKKWIRSLFGI